MAAKRPGRATGVQTKAEQAATAGKAAAVRRSAAARRAAAAEGRSEQVAAVAAVAGAESRSERGVAERRFRAMGSDAHVIVVGGPPGLLDAAVERVANLERRWSRFLPDSEVSQLNRWAGIPVAVSPDTVNLVEHAIVAWRLSGGAFDPTVLGAVVRAGYDRSFERLRQVRVAGSAALPPDQSVLGVRAGSAPILPTDQSVLGLGADEIVVRGEAVLLPAGTGFDPGGIGKGLAADLVAAEAMASGAEGICVNLGGDLRVIGTGPGDSAWTVAVEHPQAPDPIASLGLADGAVATSTTLRRRWQVDDQVRHHLIDPQTGQPSDTDLTGATVVAGQAWIAEVLAKAVLLAGSAHPFDILGGTGAQALAVDREGAVRATPGFSNYLGGNAWRTSLASNE